ncbi:MAG: hypoxanthine phosphoribosyltransferase [Aquificaceae bacterium]|nr:hypoxanthine phosphoribosyltransferase [Aquificaceae bacterium]MCX8060079.1 hypoxanthine phosphoribosyltransferase [Aquificaceae bacterium]MDW8096949.1 hypoxanthine phosphoribosyltransferase [Aquificaceae bacterium]
MHIKGRPLKLLLSEEQIQRRIEELAEEIQRHFSEPFLVVGLLKGAFVFTADLIRSFTLPVQVDFMWVSSYGSSQESQGHIKIVKDLDRDLEGLRLLLVDDILDTGYTLAEVYRLLQLKGAKEIKTCVLLDKKERRKADFSADFVGFEVPNLFLVGYGLDWDEEGRNLRSIYAVL